MGVSTPGARRIVAVAFALLAAIVVPSAVEPTPAEAEPVLGGQLRSTGGTIQVEVLPATAGLTSQLYLLEPGPEVFIATNREVGKVVELGPFDPGVELVFGIRVRGNEYRTGPAAAATVTSPRKTAITIRVFSSTDFNGGFDMTLLQLRSQTTTCPKNHDTRQNRPDTPPSAAGAADDPGRPN